MNSTIVTVLNRLRAAGWNVADSSVRPGSVTLHGASSELRAWTAAFDFLVSPDEAVWFLSHADYAKHEGLAFPWNVWEKLSLNAATTADQTRAVTEFWGRHRPILISVRGPYAYLAEREDGVIVAGEDPEFEEATPVAASLGVLLDAIAGVAGEAAVAAALTATLGSARLPACP